MSRKIFIAGTALTLLLGSCTKLEERYNADITFNPAAGTGTAPNVSNLLAAVYNSMRGNFQDQTGVFALWEMTTDELIGPTRGPDWDDNGAWRVLHNHRFDADHVRVQQVFNDLGSTVFQATDLLRFNPSPQQAAEARLIRAMANFMWLDGWDQVPYRDPGEGTIEASRVRKGLEALDYIISEINAIMANLPEGGTVPKIQANKDAARVLLMKCYLNKGVYQNRANPTFNQADMQQVITLADQVIPRYSFAANYYDNFAPNNHAIGRENIWTQENIGGTSSANIRSRWHAVTHYNQFPSGWNGFSTLADFYSKFEQNDVRIGTAYPTNSSVYTNPGRRRNIGFLEGQQYDLRTDAPLKDRKGNNLVFTKEVDIIEKSNATLERSGVRAYKYAIDYPNDANGNWDNDYVYFRLADVMLMKAEALLRTNQAGPALLIVNQIRANRGASALANVTLDNLIDERGRELYLESWRRQDLIRFGKFLLPREEKPQASDPRYLLFPIPNGQLAANPNLTQNPGY